MNNFGKKKFRIFARSHLMINGLLPNQVFTICSRLLFIKINPELSIE